MYEQDQDLQEMHRQALVKLFRSTSNADKKTKQIIQYLEKNPELILLRFVKNRTLLHMAVIKELPGLVEHLIKHYPELMELKDSKNKSGLNRAVLLNKPHMVDIFRKAIFPSLVHHQVDETQIEELSKEFSSLQLFKSVTYQKQDASAPNDDQSIKDFTQATNHIKCVNDELEDLGQQLETHLLYAGFETHYASNTPTQEAPIWELCSGYQKSDANSQESKRRFDKKLTSEILQGILSERSPVDVIKDIKQFWKDFDNNQKLTAVFIVKELLFWDVSHALIAKEVDIKSTLEKLFSNIKKDFPNYGVNMVFLLNEILGTKEKLVSNKSYIRYLLLGDWEQSSYIVKEKKSFEELLLETLSMKEKKQKNNIERIANEFRSIMIGFYHTVTINEYYNSKWNKEQSPHLIRQIDIFNSLSDFIQTFILQSQTPKECAQRMSLFIHVAAQLCCGTHDFGADFGSVNIISTVFTTPAVARLKPCLALLSEKDRNLLETLKKLNSPGCSFQMARKVAKAMRMPLINSGLLQSDIRFAYENENTAHRHEALGVGLQQILKYKRSYSLLPFRFETNLLYLLDQGRYITNWKHFYCLSGRFVPVSLDAMPLEDFIEIIDFMINNTFFPMVRDSQTEYSPELSVEPILDKMNAHLYRDKSHGEDEDIQGIIVKARKAARDLIYLVNNTYNKKYSFELIDQYLPLQSTQASKKMERNSIEYENPPVYIVKKSQPASKRHTIESEQIPVNRRRKRLS